MSKQCLYLRCDHVFTLTVIFLMKFLILYCVTSAFGALLHKPQQTCSFQNMSWYWFELYAAVCLYHGLISGMLLFIGMYVCMYVCLFNVNDFSHLPNCKVVNGFYFLINKCMFTAFSLFRIQWSSVYEQLVYKFSFLGDAWIDNCYFFN
jgi:accessory gene regulator protein AgrB